MKLSIFSSALLLSAAATPAAAAGDPHAFGRSMRKRFTGLDRIQHYGEDAARRVRPGRHWSKTAKSSHTLVLSPDEAAEPASTAVAANSKTSKSSHAPVLSPDAASVATMNSKTSKKSESALSRDESADARGATGPVVAVESVDTKASKKSASSADGSAKKSKSPDDSKAAKKSHSADGSVESKSQDSKSAKRSADESADSKASQDTKASKQSKQSRSAFSPDEPSKKSSSSSSEDAPEPKSKTSKTTSLSSSEDLPDEPNSMSMSLPYEFDPDDDLLDDDDDLISMSFSLDYSMPGFVGIDAPAPWDPPSETASPVLVAPPTEPAPSESISGIDYGKVTFEYLRQCSGMGLDLDIDGCFLSEIIDAFMNADAPDDDATYGRLRRLRDSRRELRVRRAADGSRAGLRFLQASDEECAPPRITEAFVLPFMEAAREQCAADGSAVSDEEFDRVLLSLLRILSHRSCWEDLCDEASDPSALLMGLIFDQAAQCAGVELNMEECALDHIVELMIQVGEEEDDEGCDQPTEADLAFFVNFMVIDAAAKCAETNVTLSKIEWSRIAMDLVVVFSADRCWGVEDCLEYPASSADASTAYSLTDASIDFEAPSEDDGSFLTDEGRVCVFDADVDASLERDIELVYYYQVETVSDDQDRLEESLGAIEEALISMACSDSERRSRRLEDSWEAQVVLASVGYLPEDITIGNCPIESPGAGRCDVIKGTLTLAVVGDSDYDGDVLQSARSEVEDMFTYLSEKVDDSNLVSVRYTGKASAEDVPDRIPDDAEPVEPPAGDEPAREAPADDGRGSPMDQSPQDTPNAPTVNGINNDANGTSPIQALLLAASGGVIAVAVLMGGFYRLNQREEPRDDEHATQLDEKSADGSDAGQSTSHHTADLTYAASYLSSAETGSTGCDRSEASSLPSPARSLDGQFSGALSPNAHRGSPAKFFVVAEEEEASWRDLSILPQLKHDDGTLEGVSEEGEFVGSLSSASEGSGAASECGLGESHGQMSV